MKYRLHIFILGISILSLLASGCAGRKIGESKMFLDRDSVSNRFPLPAIPDSIRQPNDRVRFMLDKYWTAVNWKSEMARKDTATMEQGMVNYLELLQHADSATVTNSFRSFLHSIPRDARGMGEYLIHLSSDYLFSPDSPVYNPQVYACTIDALIAENVPDETSRSRFLRHHEMIMKNRPGSKATDFNIVTRGGEKTSLKRLVNEFASNAGPESSVILFFYDPECENCETIEKRLAKSEKLNADIRTGKILFLAVDPFGTEKAEWEKHAADLPINWIVGFSPEGEVDAEELYMLRASPTVYILSPDLTVLAQDVAI